jgi:hypothetical protein
MIRPFACSLVAGIALLTAPIGRAHEIFPVAHTQPITVRILTGKGGQPLAHLHLILVGGYDRSDMHDQLFREEALTDARGQARLSNQMANLPWLQVWVNGKPLCQSNPRKASFSVELIRRDGLSTPNHCGPVMVEDAPGVFNVFVKGKAKKAPADVFVARATVPAQAPVAPPAPTPPVPAPAQKPVEAEAALPAPPVAVIAVAVPAPITPTAAPVEAALKTVLPAQTAATPALAVVPASAPAKAAERLPLRRVAARPTARRATPAAHRARPLRASCQVQPQTAKPAPVEAPDLSASKMARARARALGVSPKSKPPAGVRQIDAPPANPTPPPKQE